MDRKEQQEEGKYKKKEGWIGRHSRRKIIIKVKRRLDRKVGQEEGKYKMKKMLNRKVRQEEGTSGGREG